MHIPKANLIPMPVQFRLKCGLRNHTHFHKQQDHTVHSVGDIAKRSKAGSADSVVLRVVDGVDEDLVGQDQATLARVGAHIRTGVDVGAKVLAHVGRKRNGAFEIAHLVDVAQKACTGARAVLTVWRGCMSLRVGSASWEMAGETLAPFY